mgnify:CR=1 FL=1
MGEGVYLKDGLVEVEGRRGSAHLAGLRGRRVSGAKTGNERERTSESRDAGMGKYEREELGDEARVLVRDEDRGTLVRLRR